MNILILLVPFSLLLGLTFVVGFVWTVKTRQLEDLETPAHRIFDDK